MQYAKKIELLQNINVDVEFNKKEVKHKIKFELFGILICWFIYSNAMTFFDYYVYIKDKTITSNNDEIIILSITLAAFYISLFFNGYFPIILFFSYKTSVGYHFEPKLTTNLYLFLANEHCYGAFNDFLKYSQQKNDVFYLKLYTSIMKYKLMYIAHEPEGEIVDEGKKINKHVYSILKELVTFLKLSISLGLYLIPELSIIFCTVSSCEYFKDRLI